MTFHHFFHDLFKFSVTLGSAVTFENFQNFPCCREFLTLNSSTGTNSGVHRNKSLLRCSIPPLYIIVSYIVLALSPAVKGLSNKTLIFHDFQGPTIKIYDFPGLENEILKFHDFPGFP